MQCLAMCKGGLLRWHNSPIRTKYSAKRKWKEDKTSKAELQWWGGEAAVPRATVRGNLLSAFLKPLEDTFSNLTKMRRLKTRKFNFITLGYTAGKQHSQHTDLAIWLQSEGLFPLASMNFQVLKRRIWAEMRCEPCLALTVTDRHPANQEEAWARWEGHSFPLWSRSLFVAAQREGCLYLLLRLKGSVEY